MHFALLRCCAVTDLIALLQQCQDDTEKLLGHLAAPRLGNWRRHSTSDQKLVEYVQRLLWGEHCANGKRLDEQGGLSLERIVLDHASQLFSDPDRAQARRTLGIGK
jgi:hypothetical protein